MPRRREIPKRDVRADPIYQSPLVSKFINCVMYDGKRSTAERIMYKAFDIIKEKTGDDPVKGFIFDLGHADRTVYEGQDVTVGQNRSWCPQSVGGEPMGQLVMVRLSDGKVTSLTQPNTAQAYHVSCRNFGRAGWCYASFHSEYGSGKPFFDEIMR